MDNVTKKAEMTPEELAEKYFPIRNILTATDFYKRMQIEQQNDFLADLRSVIRGRLIEFTQPFYADEETCIHNVDVFLNNNQ